MPKEKEQHTPGLWTIEKCRCGHPFCEKYCLTNPPSTEGKFNRMDALLIAAAPELLEVAKTAKKLLENWFCATADDIQQVIDKAEGKI